MHTLYFIPGLGADEQLFSKLELEGFKKKYNKWIPAGGSCPAGYYHHAIQMILGWENNHYPENLLHIHGENDRLFPIRNIKDPVAIKRETHFIPFHNAREIEEIIRKKIGR